MAKVLINFSVEEHIAVAFKTAIPTRERSAVIERFMWDLARLQESNQETAELQDEVNGLREQLHELGTLLSQKCALLEMKRTKESEERTKEIAAKERLYDTIMANNPLDK